MAHVERAAELSIFLSCGTPHNAQQERFIVAVEAHLAAHGCRPLTVGRSAYSSRQPVEAARDLIANCHGAVVIAFERTRIVEGLDRPDTPRQRRIEGERHPTVWNQMEAAMAYARKLPILTLVQHGLTRHGMLSTRLEWKAMETELTPEFLLQEEFRQVFADWLGLVRKGSAAAGEAPLDPAEIKLGRLVSQLTLKQALAVLTGSGLAAAAVASAGFAVGQRWPSDFAHAPAGAASATPASPTASRSRGG